MIRPGKIIRASKIEDIPQYTKSPTISELIILSLSEPRSSFHMSRKLNVTGTSIRPLLSHMVADGKIESMKCDKCGIGVMYKKK